MKKRHVPALKFHTLFTLCITAIFIVVSLAIKSLSLGIAMAFLAIYVAGNGLIHIRRNELARDTVVEYILISAIAAVLVVGSIVNIMK